MTELEAIAAIRNYRKENGFNPSRYNVAHILGCSLRSLDSALGMAKNRGDVFYDSEGCLVVKKQTFHESLEVVMDSVEPWQVVTLQRAIRVKA